MYGCDSWTMKKAEHQRIDAFELWYWRRLLRVPWTARKSNQSILKEISPEYALEGPLKQKLQYLATWYELIHWKRPRCWERLKEEEKGTTEDEMVGWHHRLSGHEFEQAPGVGDGQRSLVCCSPLGCRVRLNWALNWRNWQCHIGRKNKLYFFILESINICFFYLERVLYVFLNWFSKASLYSWWCTLL